MSDTPDSRTGDVLVRVGAVVFGVGALATLVTMAPLFLHTTPLPSGAYALCMLMGVGFVIAAAGVLRGVSAQHRQLRATVAAVPDATPVRQTTRHS